MRKTLSTVLAGLALIAGGSARAGMLTVAVPVVPVARGPVVRAINAQLAPLAAALSGPVAQRTWRLTSAFQTRLAPAPDAATPEAFAARSAVASALASPAVELPALTASLRAAGGNKAEKAALSLEKIGRALTAAKPDELGTLTEAAAALVESFDGASAAPGETVDLSLFPANDENGLSSKKADKKLREEVKELAALHNTLASSKNQAVLVVYDAFDAAGKGGTIKHTLTGLNPAYIRVAAFKKPTPEEARQYFLERIKKEVPKSGILGVFDRSHYEDIIVPTVLGTHDVQTIEARYARINAFELELARRGVKLVKIHLRMSKAVQRERFERRIDQPEKNWKFSMFDLDTRKLWDKYEKARSEVFSRTSTWHAPWHLIAADDKPRRNLAAARLLRRTMERMRLSYPLSPELKDVKIPR
jgi:PPK2 family polyphosphate:nucleotide phosphotransferase